MRYKGCIDPHTIPLLGTSDEKERRKSLCESLARDVPTAIVTHLVVLKLWEDFVEVFKKLDNVFRSLDCARSEVRNRGNGPEAEFRERPRGRTLTSGSSWTYAFDAMYEYPVPTG